MKKIWQIIVAALVLYSAWSYGGDFSVSISDDSWDGVTVPEGQQCQKFGGTPSSPPLSVSEIPEGTNLLIIEFSDTSYEPMSNGGHGKLGFALSSNVSAVEIAPVAGHTFDLPTGFITVTAHQAPTWDLPGAYLAPCSGGKGNLYRLTVKAAAVSSDGIEILAESSVDMGKF